jgi:hypothetical protein
LGLISCFIADRHQYFNLLVRLPMFRAGLLKGELGQGPVDLRPYDVQVVKERLFVEAMVDVLKYPTAALTAREPNAREPRNATDIFLQVLAERKELKILLDAQNKGSGRRCRINILDTIVGDQRFKHIRLMTQPNDPRINRPKQ